MQFLPCSLNTVLFLSPQPAFCLQGTKSPPETRRHGTEKKKKSCSAVLGWPIRRRYVDKAGAFSHGLAPIGSRPEDKQILSTLWFYPPTTHLLKLSYSTTGERNQSSLRFAFEHRKKPITAVKQHTGERIRVK